MTALFPTYARWNIEPDTAKGSWLTSKEGKNYLDYTSGIGVLNLGHGNEKVKASVERQLERFWHTSNLFENSEQEQAALLLAKASGLNRTFFANSGAEANEAAIKLARKATGKSKIVTCTQSFHGRTFATMAATGQEKIRVGYGTMLDGFTHVPYNNTAALEEAVDDQTAAIMLEVVQGEGGIHLLDVSYAEAIMKLKDKYDILLIIDEIQTGIGRTGKPFAFQHFAIQPDIITLAKGLGNGLPIGAMLGREDLAEFFGPGSHGSTFGGNPISISAAIAVLSEVMNPQFLKETAEKGIYFMQQLKWCLENSEYIVEIRGLGLMIGIELKDEAAPIVQELQNSGLLLLTAGTNVIRILPPLTTDKNEIDLAVEKIANILKPESIPTA